MEIDDALLERLGKAQKRLKDARDLFHGLPGVVEDETLWNFGHEKDLAEVELEQAVTRLLLVVQRERMLQELLRAGKLRLATPDDGNERGY